jgi:hypothetical protein
MQHFVPQGTKEQETDAQIWEGQVWAKKKTPQINAGSF